MKFTNFLFLLPMLFLLTAAGCTKNTEIQAPTDTIGIRYLALGDSYTIGESVSASERFPAQVAQWFKEKAVEFQQPRYIAQTGWTTADLQQAIQAAGDLGTYQVVTLLAGVNDQYQRKDTAGYRIRFTQLVQKAISLAGNRNTRVSVLSIPDYGVTPFGGGSQVISREIDAFNSINKEISLAYQLTYVDITPISREAGTDQTLTANDGLHPSGKQYKRWTDVLAPLIQKILP